MFLANVKQRGYWPVHASTLLFFLIPKNVTAMGVAECASNSRVEEKKYGEMG